MKAAEKLEPGEYIPRMVGVVAPYAYLVWMHCEEEDLHMETLCDCKHPVWRRYE